MIKSKDEREASRIQKRKDELGERNIVDGIELKETDSGPLQMKEDLDEPRS